MTDVLIGFALDESGSMLSVKTDTMNGFNQFIADQRKEPGEARLTLSLFNTTARTQYSAELLDNVKELGTVDNPYAPRGNTALLDAVGNMITEMEMWLMANNFTGKVVCVIQTDGAENASNRWHIKHPADPNDSFDLTNLIQEKQNNGWDFLFLGQGGSEWLERTFGNVAKGNTFAFAASDAGQTYHTVSRGLSGLRANTAGGQSMSVAYAAALDNPDETVV